MPTNLSSVRFDLNCLALASKPLLPSPFVTKPAIQNPTQLQQAADFASKCCFFVSRSCCINTMAVDGAPMSFAAAMEKKTDSSPLRNVQLDGLAVLKILKHCKESMPSLVTGQLLGLDIGQTLEVTDCFPFPVSSAIKITSKVQITP